MALQRKAVAVVEFLRFLLRKSAREEEEGPVWAVGSLLLDRCSCVIFGSSEISGFSGLLERKARCRGRGSFGIVNNCGRC